MVRVEQIGGEAALEVISGSVERGPGELREGCAGVGVLRALEKAACGASHGAEFSGAEAAPQGEARPFGACGGESDEAPGGERFLGAEAGEQAREVRGEHVLGARAGGGAPDSAQGASCGFGAFEGDGRAEGANGRVRPSGGDTEFVRGPHGVVVGGGDRVCVLMDGAESFTEQRLRGVGNRRVGGCGLSIRGRRVGGIVAHRSRAS